jgi:YesN/AraC family two-component response regulator
VRVACYESDFQDIGYFYRVFKKYTGQTPGDLIAGCEEQ